LVGFCRLRALALVTVLAVLTTSSLAQVGIHQGVKPEDRSFAAEFSSALTGLEAAEYPFSVEAWQELGWLVHYDWGISAYAFIDADFFYFAIFGASSVHAVYLSTDIDDSESYEIEGAFFQYVLSSVGPSDSGWSGAGGLFWWNATADTWVRLEGAGQVDHVQGKVALTALGSPEQLFLIFQAVETAPIRLPQHGYAYIDTEAKLGISFTAQKPMAVIPHPHSDYPWTIPEPWRIWLNETAELRILLKNFSPQTLHCSSTLILPPHVHVASGSLVWNTTLAGFDDVQRVTTIQGDRLGVWQLFALIVYGGSESTLLSQRFAVVPRVEAHLQGPETSVLMHEHAVNLTVRSLEAMTVAVTLVPTRGCGGSEFIVTLAPLATVSVSPVVVVEGATLEYQVTFEGLIVAEAQAKTSFTIPQIEIAAITIDAVPYNYSRWTVETNTVHDIAVEVHNPEVSSYPVTVHLEDASMPTSVIEALVADRSSATQTVPPGSNGTLHFRLATLAVNSTQYVGVRLEARVGIYYCDDAEVRLRLTPTDVPWYAPLLTAPTLAAVAAALLAGGAIGFLAVRTRKRP
jgi:hypothetical protein